MELDEYFEPVVMPESELKFIRDPKWAKLLAKYRGTLRKKFDEYLRADQEDGGENQDPSSQVPKTESNTGGKDKNKALKTAKAKQTANQLQALRRYKGKNRR
jgi:hypothetical protein